jgi:transcriptional repressor NrdR
MVSSNTIGCGNMKCPYCGSNDTKVLDKRETEEDLVTRRRRECLKCQKRFTTYERVELADIMVIKKNKDRETFNRDKLKSGITKACEKRPVTPEQINSAVDKIEIKIRNMESTEVESTVIGDLVMKELKKLDKVAYIRFASVYREFEDIGEFAKEVKSLKE